jgi:DNA-directed RNA polymerase specialized sigma24 family protein
VISPDELEREIEDLVTDCGAGLERRLRYGSLRLPEHLVGEVINDALLVIVDKRRRGHTIANPQAYLSAVARNAAIDRLRTLYAAGIPDPDVTADAVNGHDMLAHVEISHDLRTARSSSCVIWATSAWRRPPGFSTSPPGPWAPPPPPRCAG